MGFGGKEYTYARELTSIVVSEIFKLEKYEVYSLENVRNLAGWTAEMMKLGCTSTQCLTALGQMDIAKLISGSVGKIGNRYSISLNLFDTQNVRVEKALSEFCLSEDELIELSQQAICKLLGVPFKSIVIEAKSTEEQVLAQTLKGMVNSYNSGNINKHVAYYAADAKIYSFLSGRLELVSREDYKKNLWRNVQNLPTIELKQTRITVISPDRRGVEANLYLYTQRSGTKTRGIFYEFIRREGQWIVIEQKYR